MGDDDHGPIRAALGVYPAGHDTQSVDIEAGVGLVQDGQRRFEDRHLQGFVALLLAAGEPLVDRAAHEAAVHLDQLHPLLGHGQELRHIERVEAPSAPQRVERGAQKVQVADPGDLDRVLEGQEDAGGGAVLGRQGQQVLPLEGHRSGDVIGVVAGEDVGQGGLTRPVGAHDGVHFAGADLEVDASENLVPADAGVKVSDVQHHPTLPSRLTLSSRFASTANSIGSSLNTSRQKPLTIMATASSSEIPRWRQ